MPITWPSRSTSAPPELPGLIGALVWIARGITAPLPSGTVRPSEDTMPCVTLERSPSGLPIANATSPTASLPESANAAGFGAVAGDPDDGEILRR